MTTPDHSSNILFSGSWDENIHWEFHLSKSVPDSDLCTAVYCLAIVDAATPEGIVLARNRRGWEMLGGHIEPGESLQEALVRESLEEGGFYPAHLTPFGFRKVIANMPIRNDHHGGHYPPVAFIPHFFATTDRITAEPTGSEILEADIFQINALPPMEESQVHIALAGIEAFRRSKL